MQIHILSISDSDKHFDTACQEYTKRLWKSTQIKNIKPIKWESQEHTIKKETEQIMDILEKDYKWYYKILLIKSWTQLDTIQLKQQLIWKWKIVFIIWWPYWLDEENINKHIDTKISFWKITLPHWLAKLVLLEQIYRIQTLQSWKKYHY